MRGGALLRQLNLKDKAYYTFGRTPNNDIILEHPTSSRYGVEDAGQSPSRWQEALCISFRRLGTGQSSSSAQTISCCRPLMQVARRAAVSCI